MRWNTRGTKRTMRQMIYKETGRFTKMKIYPSGLGSHVANLPNVMSVIVVLFYFAMTWNVIMGIALMWIVIDSYITYSNEVDISTSYVVCNQLLFKSLLITTATCVRYPHYLLLVYGTGFFYYVWFVPEKTLTLLYADNAMVSFLLLLAGAGLRRGKMCGIGNALFVMNMVMVYEEQHRTPVFLYKAMVNTCIIMAATFGYTLLTNKLQTAEPLSTQDYELTTAQAITGMQERHETYT